MIDLVVDDKESVVRLVEGLDVYGCILGVMPGQVELELRGDLLGINGSLHSGRALIQEDQDRFVNMYSRFSKRWNTCALETRKRRMAAKASII